MRDYELLCKQLTIKYGSQNGLHERMKELNARVESLSFDEYFAKLKEICKNNTGAYHVYFDRYMKWYESEGINIVPQS